MILIFEVMLVSYFTINKEAKAELEEKKSLFIGHVKRVNSEEEAKDFINRIKSEHKEARHNVFAYVIGQNMGTQRYSDDGEPQGTGGIPVLEVIKKNGITDTVVVVTRYFGGILLGASGLTRAYSKAASLAVKQGEVVEKVLGCILKVIIDYDLFGKIQYEFNQKMLFIEETEYTDKITFRMNIELDNLEKVQDMLKEISAGKAITEVQDKGYFFKMENRLFIEVTKFKN